MQSATDRVQWMIKEGVIIATILLFWRAISLLANYGIGNIGMRNSSNVFTMIGSAVGSTAMQAGLATVVLYIFMRAGVYLIDYYNADL